MLGFLFSHTHTHRHGHTQTNRQLLDLFVCFILVKYLWQRARKIYYICICLDVWASNSSFASLRIDEHVQLLLAKLKNTFTLSNGRMVILVSVTLHSIDYGQAAEKIIFFSRPCKTHTQQAKEKNWKGNR